MWISNATIADVINVTCKMERDGKSEMVRILVEKEQSEFEAREIPVIGMNQSHLGEVVFEDCRVPKDNLLAGSDESAKILTLTWLANRPIIGLCAVQMAQRAFEMAKTFAKDRKQFGRSIGAFQLIQERLADIETAIVRAVYSVITRLPRWTAASVPMASLPWPNGTPYRHATRRSLLQCRCTAPWD